MSGDTVSEEIKFGNTEDARGWIKDHAVVAETL
jgi:hypothetical protein